MADDILSNVNDAVRNVVAALQQGNTHYSYLKNTLTSCIDDVNRIEDTLDEHLEVVRSIQDIINHVESLERRSDHTTTLAEQTEPGPSFALPRIPPPKGKGLFFLLP